MYIVLKRKKKKIWDTKYIAKLSYSEKNSILQIPRVYSHLSEKIWNWLTPPPPLVRKNQKLPVSPHPLVADIICEQPLSLWLYGFFLMYIIWLQQKGSLPAETSLSPYPPGPISGLIGVPVVLVVDVLLQILHRPKHLLAVLTLHLVIILGHLSLLIIINHFCNFFLNFIRQFYVWEAGAWLPQQPYWLYQPSLFQPDNPTRTAVSPTNPAVQHSNCSKFHGKLSLFSTLCRLICKHVNTVYIFHIISRIVMSPPIKSRVYQKLLNLKLEVL